MREMENTYWRVSVSWMTYIKNYVTEFYIIYFHKKISKKYWNFVLPHGTRYGNQMNLNKYKLPWFCEVLSDGKLLNGECGSEIYDTKHIKQFYENLT